MQKLQTVVESFSIANSVASLVAKVLEHVRTPLYRNAYAWMFSTGLSSVLGIVYWLLAARLYPTEAVGLNAALVSGMIFLSGVAQLDLMSALVRFVPNAGASTRRLITSAYFVSLGLALVLGTLTLATIGLIGAEKWEGLNLFPFDLRLGVWFVLATAAWCIFALQDSALTGLRDAVWVPVENVLYAVVKIVLLILFARYLPAYGIFASWILPAAALIIPMNWLIFQRLVPRHVRQTQSHARVIAVRSIAKYVFGNYIGSLFTLSSARLLPVLILFLAGAAANAYFNLAWQIANALKMVLTHMTMSLTVEGARQESHLVDYGQRFFVSLLAICIPAALFVIVAAPFILGLSGRDYGTESVPVLRLMVISVIPSTITVLYVGMARVQNHAWRIATVMGLFSISLLGVSALLLPTQGIVGVGIAMLLSESLVASVILISRRASTRQAVVASSV